MVSTAQKFLTAVNHSLSSMRGKGYEQLLLEQLSLFSYNSFVIIPDFFFSFLSFFKHRFIRSVAEFSSEELYDLRIIIIVSIIYFIYVKYLYPAILLKGPQDS